MFQTSNQICYIMLQMYTSRMIVDMLGVPLILKCYIHSFFGDTPPSRGTPKKALMGDLGAPMEL